MYIVSIFENVVSISEWRRVKNCCDHVIDFTEDETRNGITKIFGMTQIWLDKEHPYMEPIE